MGAAEEGAEEDADMADAQPEPGPAAVAAHERAGQRAPRGEPALNGRALAPRGGRAAAPPPADDDRYVPERERPADARRTREGDDRREREGDLRREPRGADARRERGRDSDARRGRKAERRREAPGEARRERERRQEAPGRTRRAPRAAAADAEGEEGEIDVQTLEQCAAQPRCRLSSIVQASAGEVAVLLDCVFTACLRLPLQGARTLWSGASMCEQSRHCSGGCMTSSCLHGVPWNAK